MTDMSENERDLGYTNKPRCEIFPHSKPSYVIEMMCFDRHSFVVIEYMVVEFKFGEGWFL